MKNNKDFSLLLPEIIIDKENFISNIADGWSNLDMVLNEFISNVSNVSNALLIWNKDKKNLWINYDIKKQSSVVNSLFNFVKLNKWVINNKEKYKLLQILLKWKKSYNFAHESLDANVWIKDFIEWLKSIDLNDEYLLLRYILRFNNIITLESLNKISSNDEDIKQLFIWDDFLWWPEIIQPNYLEIVENRLSNMWWSFDELKSSIFWNNVSLNLYRKSISDLWENLESSTDWVAKSTLNKILKIFEV